MMHTHGATLLVAALALGVIGASAAHAQDAARDPLQAQDAPPAPDIEMLLRQPPHSGGPDSAFFPDVRDLPPPKMDTLSKRPPVTVTISDPRCLPGEDGFVDPRRAPRSRRPR